MRISPQQITEELADNGPVFEKLLTGLAPDMYNYRQAPEKWNLLEVVCHMIDSEIEDFRARARHCLEHPGTQPPSIDPEGWVKARSYASRNYEEQLHIFLSERKASVEWLRNLGEVDWERHYDHSEFGRLTARHFLNTWLAHDLLHIRQISAIKYAYLDQGSTESLLYAGPW